MSQIDSNSKINGSKVLSVSLDDYSDIYSDFDSRHYTSRRISEDFLNELRNDIQYREKPFEELCLLIPELKRNEDTEGEIVNSLKKFFKQQFHTYKLRAKRKFRISLVLLFTGIIIMMLNATLIFLEIHSILFTLLSTILEPASWFLLWTSIDYLLYDWKELMHKKLFFERFSEISIVFKNQ